MTSRGMRWSTIHETLAGGELSPGRRCHFGRKWQQ
jgi:hypothetical protein